MGRGYDDRDKKKDFLIRQKIQETWGYSIRKPKSGTSEDIEVKIGSEWFTPQDISSLILRKLRKIAEREDEKVDGAVITVPAYFNDKQKWATREAARLAGHNVQMVLDEPTAAAIAYGMATLGEEPKTVIVYDLGGGTFDISLLQIEGANFNVSAIEGDNWLGGDDFDLKIVEYVLNEIGGICTEKIKNDPINKSRLKQRAREAKEELSEKTETSIKIADLLPGKQDILLTRKEFENMIHPEIHATLELVDKVLEKSSMTEDEIDKVLLVGGSTRIPLVRRCLIEKFGEEKIAAEIDPMQCVAIGAAIKSSWLLDTWECPNPNVKCEHINDKTNFLCSKCGYPRPDTKNATERPYGLKIYDEGKKRYVFDVLIPEYTSYPLMEPKKRTFDIHDKNARLLKIPFYSGEKSDKKSHHDEIEKNTHLGTLLAILPKGQSTKSTVEISFNLNNDGILDLENISITLTGNPVEDKAIIRSGEEENVVNEIEELLSSICGNISNIDERDGYVNSTLEILKDLFEYGKLNDKNTKEERIKEILNKIGTIKQKINVQSDSESLIIKGAKNIALFSLHVEDKYGWLPFIQDKSRKQEIQNIREKLKEKIEANKSRKNISKDDEWEIMKLTLELSRLLSDNTLDLLLEMKVAADIAETGKLADIGDIITWLTKSKDKYKTSEAASEKKSKGERIKDAEKLRKKKTKIEMLLEQGGKDKISEAKSEYSESSDLVMYYLTEFTS